MAAKRTRKKATTSATEKKPSALHLTSSFMILFPILVTPAQYLPWIRMNGPRIE